MTRLLILLTESINKNKREAFSAECNYQIVLWACAVALRCEEYGPGARGADPCDWFINNDVRIFIGYLLQINRVYL